MRHGRLCALWFLLLSCSPGGDGGGDSVVAPNAFGRPNQQAPTGTVDPTAPDVTNQGDLFGNDSDLGCAGGCAFAAQPLLDEGVGANDITPFAASEDFQAGSLCVIEPQLSSGTQPGALFPRNWLRPRFRWSSTGSETLWEIRLHAEGQPEDLRAYTREKQWAI